MKGHGKLYPLSCTKPFPSNVILSIVKVSMATRHNDIAGYSGEFSEAISLTDDTSSFSSAAIKLTAKDIPGANLKELLRHTAYQLCNGGYYAMVSKHPPVGENRS